MVSGTTTLLLLLAFISLTVASICPQGKEFLNYELQRCVNCTVCDSEKGMVVLTPCEVHQDTRCVSLSKLNLNWNLRDHRVENPHRHNHQKHHRRKDHKNDRNGKAERGGNEDRNIANDSGEAGVSHGVSDGAVDDGGVGSGGAAIGVTNSEVPLSSIEALVWDWQAIALTLAVFSCILFFLIIALYSLHQARQWRRLKENFEAGKFT